MKITDNIYMYPESGVLDANTYLVKNGDETLTLIDAGNEQSMSRKIREIMRDNLVVQDITTIINTHLHIDHFWANESFKQLSGAKILIHPLQKEHWNAMVVQLARGFGLEPVQFNTDGMFEGNDINGLEIVPAPGHSPDSICYYEKTSKALFCGDVLFAQNTGRVDLPLGSAAQLKKSISDLSNLDIEYLLPGHMNSISGHEAVKKNFEFIKENVFEWL